MARICFIGNSHLVAIKLALQSDATSGLTAMNEIDTFGSPLESLAQTLVKDAVLVPQSDIVEKNLKWTSGGKDRIALSDYQAIYFVAGLSPLFLPLYFGGHNIAPVSDSIVQAIKKAWRNSWYAHLLLDIAAAVPSVPVHFIGQPFFPENHPRSRRILKRLNNPKRSSLGSKYHLNKMRDAVRASVEGNPIADNVEILAPPTVMLEKNGVFTKKAFSLNARRMTEDLDTPYLKKNLVHMNSDYGACVLNTLLGPIAG